MSDISGKVFKPGELLRHNIFKYTFGYLAKVVSAEFKSVDENDYINIQADCLLVYLAPVPKEDHRYSQTRTEVFCLIGEKIVQIETAALELVPKPYC